MENKTPEQVIRDTMSAAAATQKQSATPVTSQPDTASAATQDAATKKTAAPVTQAQADAQTTQEAVGKTYRVQENGSAPQGLSVGDRVVTGGGTYAILAVNPDGTYKSQNVDPNQTTANYKGDYASLTTPTGKFYQVGSGGKAPAGLNVGDQVVTAGGTYIVDAINPDGSYQSTRVNSAQTTNSFRGKYSVQAGADPVEDMKSLLDQWLTASKEQSSNQIDYATEKGVNDLNRAMEDAAQQYQTQRNQTAADEARALDNSALYAEARGDKGGIGQAQYNEIQAAALQNRQAINAAQTKLATDTARQIADLRARGEFEKADALLQLTQQQLSQLISLEQWGAEYAMSKEQMQQSLEQWQKEYELNKANVSGYFTDGTPTRATTESAREAAANIASALIEAGIMPSSEQLAALGMTEQQARSYMMAKGLQAAATGRSGSGGGGRSSGGSSSGTSGGSSTAGTAANQRKGSQPQAWWPSTGLTADMQDGHNYNTQTQKAFGSQAGAVQNAIQKGTAAPTTSAKYTTLNTYPRQWDDINRYAEGGMSRADLVKTITKWKNEGKISATAADEMARSFNLG